MKTVLLSIHPKYCHLIIKGEKMIVIKILSIVLMGMLVGSFIRKTIDNIQNRLFERKHKKFIEDCRRNKEKLLRKEEEQ